MRIPFFLAIALFIGLGFLLAKNPLVGIAVGGVLLIMPNLLSLVVGLYNQYRLSRFPQAKVFLDGKEFLIHYEKRIDENLSQFRSVGERNTLLRGIRYGDITKLPEDLVAHINELIELNKMQVPDGTAQSFPGRLQLEGVTIPLQLIKEEMPCPCGSEPPHFLFTSYYSSFNHEDLRGEKTLGIISIIDQGGNERRNRRKEKRHFNFGRPWLLPETNTI